MSTLEFTTLPLTHTAGMIVFRDLPFYSYCAHHNMPMRGFASIAFLPNEVTCGLFSLKRLVKSLSSTPILQEEFTHTLIENIVSFLTPLGCVVKVQGTHTCSQLKNGEWSELETWEFRGAFPQEKCPF